jgi:hypothetical protein
MSRNSTRSVQKTFAYPLQDKPPRVKYVALFKVIDLDREFCRLEVQLGIISVYKNTNHQQMHKESFIINRNTLLHVSSLLGRNM